MSRKNAAAAPVENKSKAIREWMAAHPDVVKSSEIAKQMGVEGVTPNKVANVIRMSRPKLDPNAIKSAAGFAAKHGGKLDAARKAISEVGGYIDECGSAANALAALDVYESLAASIAVASKK